MALTLPHRLLVVAPHPDDETIANGILIQRVLAAGGAVRVLLLTDGDNNPWPQRWLEKRWSIGVAERRRWGRRRRTEAAEAVRRLGLPASALQPLGWPDLGVLGRLLQPGQEALTEVVAQLVDFGPDAVALPALHDRHPDHGTAHVLLRLALAMAGQSPVLWAYLIHGDDGAPGQADASAWQATKQSALAAHASQLALSGERMRRLARRIECHVPPASRPTMDRQLPWRPSPLLWSRLRLTAASSSGLVQQWPWHAAPLRASGQGGWRLDWSAARPDDACFVRLSLALPSPWIFDHWGWCEI